MKFCIFWKYNTQNGELIDRYSRMFNWQTIIFLILLIYFANWLLCPSPALKYNRTKCTVKQIRIIIVHNSQCPLILLSNSVTFSVIYSLVSHTIVSIIQKSIHLCDFMWYAYNAKYFHNKWAIVWITQLSNDEISPLLLLHDLVCAHHD